MSIPAELVESLVRAARDHVIAYRCALAGIAKHEAAGPRILMPHGSHGIHVAQAAYNKALASYQHKVEELQLNATSPCPPPKC
jgi:hypothetical protein